MAPTASLLNGCSHRATPDRWLYGALLAHQTSLTEESGRTLEPCAADLTGGELLSDQRNLDQDPTECQESKWFAPKLREQTNEHFV